MKLITGKTFDEERALYGARELAVTNCKFDGESAFKEGSNLSVSRCFFNLRYPFWHNTNLTNLKIKNSELTPLCRAALWYSKQAEICGTKLHGIKALRECVQVKLTDCDISSPEFGCSVHRVEMRNYSAEGKYFMTRSERLRFKNVRLKGKYSFQYITDSVFDDCVLDTKDSFWHAKKYYDSEQHCKG